MDRKLIVAIAVALLALPLNTPSVLSRPALAVAGPGPAAAGLVPLADMLNSDGSLRLRQGFSGSLDVRGWRMEMAPGGAPHFVQAGPTAQPQKEQSAQPQEKQPARPQAPDTAGDQYWDDRFGRPGTSGLIDALLVSGSDLYV